MQYLTYEKYRELGGTLDATPFSNYEFLVRRLIDFHTFNRLVSDTEISENVQMCMFHLINLNEQLDTTVNIDNLNNNISSQSNDGVSVSYSGVSPKDAEEYYSDKQTKIINLYLQGEKNQAGQLLLFRGLYKHE